MPAGVIGSFARMTGVDLGFVPVVRTPRVDAAATGLHARAFTSGGVVHVPEAAGPLDRSDTEALVAHELAHVAQQRALGARARESEGLGERLEQAAQDVESAYLGLRSADTVGDILAGESGALAERGDPPQRLDELREAGGPLSWTPQHGFRAEPSPPPVQRAVLSDAAGPAEPGPAPEPSGLGSPDADPVPLAYPDLHEAAGAGPEPVPAPGAVEAAAEQPRPSPADLDEEALARLATRIGARLSVSPLDTRDPELLDQLSVRLYGRLRSRLRRELIDDRERVGLLTEFH